MRLLNRFLFFFALLPAIAAAQADRSGDWEAGFHVADFSSLSLSGFRGAAMQVESSFGYGFSGAYNFTGHFALGMDASWRSPKYLATFVPDGPEPVRVRGARMDVARIHFKGIYYFLDSNVTPFVEVGYGWTQIDSNILERPPLPDAGEIRGGVLRASPFMRLTWKRNRPTGRRSAFGGTRAAISRCAAASGRSRSTAAAVSATPVRYDADRNDLALLANCRRAASA